MERVNTGVIGTGRIGRLHAKINREAAQAGKHIFCEGPAPLQSRSRRCRRSAFRGWNLKC